MLPYSFVGQATYINGATLASVNVPVSDQADWVYVKDITNWGAASTAANPIYAEWYPLTMAPGSFLGIGQNSSATPDAVTMYATRGTSGGFTFFNPNSPPTYAALPGTAINATTLVVLMANTGTIAVGDTVKLINPTAMLQIGGLQAQVTAVTPNVSITLGYVASAVAAGLSLGANATAVSVIKFIPGNFYPRKRQVLFITQAAQAVVYFSQPNDFTPGEIVDFSIPSPYGMTQLNYLTGQPGGAPRVLSVTNSATVSSITINVNTSGYTPFVYPSSALAATSASPPVCVPAGSGIVPLNGSATIPQSPPGTNLLDAFDNRNQYFINIGLNAVGNPSATMQFFAFKADWTNLTNA